MHSSDAERAIISSLIAYPTNFDEVYEIVKPNQFSGVACGVIFKAMADLVNRGEAIDIITVAQELGSDIENIGGMQFLSDVSTSMASKTNVRTFARFVSDFNSRSVLQGKLSEASEAVDKAKDFAAALSEVNQLLGSVEPESKDYMSFDDLLHSRIQELDRRFRSGEEIEGIKTGLAPVDERFLGLRGGDLWILGGRPSMGKTAFAMSVAYNVAKNIGDVLVFSAEMQKEQLADRMISQSSKINGRKLRTAQLQDADWTKLTAGVQSLKNLPLHIIDTASIDVNHAANIARKFNRKNKLSLIVVDYLQLLRFGDLQGFECVSEVSRSLKSMAKMLDCPVLALSQLNRDVEKRVNKRPMMADLRSSGQIEQDADVISFLYRDEHYNPDSPQKGVAELINEKVRNGETGTDFLYCNLSQMEFSELNYKPDIAPAKPCGRPNL